MVDLSDPFKSTYTAEENMRAYRAFTMIDIDDNGFVTLREIERVLSGTLDDKVLSESFEEPDTGIVFGLDVEGCPIIRSIEDRSHAFLKSSLVPGLRLVRINSVEVRHCSS